MKFHVIFYSRNYFQFVSMLPKSISFAGGKNGTRDSDKFLCFEVKNSKNTTLDKFLVCRVSGVRFRQHLFFVQDVKIILSLTPKLDCSPIVAKSLRDLKFQNHTSRCCTRPTFVQIS